MFANPEQLSRAIRNRSEKFGREAHLKMSHAGRVYGPNSKDQYKKAAVLQFIYPVASSYHMVLIKRSSRNPADKHKGQIAFPGGRLEKSDASLMETALREFEEEVGVNANSVQVLGELTQLFIPVSGYVVHPYVAVGKEKPNFKAQIEEVEDIIEVPLDLLLAEETKKSTVLRINDQITLKNVPYYDIFGHIVWGATAMMLSELEHLIKWQKP
ncbi:MAG TPA: CoA pyrophosphatase [Saprospiraceae bacterium]|nr:CoA pyrophosphatase [Saprospiraceae bacterium]